jgi:hypothetical protein
MLNAVASTELRVNLTIGHDCRKALEKC